jgi:hypothetical protein
VRKVATFSSKGCLLTMKKLLPTILLLLLTLPLLAEPQKGAVRIEILKTDRSQTASLDRDLLHFKVRLTNESQKPLPYTNNRFLLKDDKGDIYFVSRPWYPQGEFLKPGDSVEFDRVYFEIRKGHRPKKLALMWGRIPLGAADCR